MTERYQAPGAFRQALDDRLRSEANKRKVPLDTLRTKLLIERLLARLFAHPNAPWLLKGGYAFELRYRPKARTTRDIDLAIVDVSGGSMESRVDAIRDALQRAAELDLNDFLVFRIGAAKGDVQGAPDGGARFPVEVSLGGRVFDNFHIDAGFGDALIGEPEMLTGDDLLAFAGIQPPRVLAVPKAQQFAEKLHAYTLPWSDRVNTRVKDLVDLLLLIDRGELGPAELREALRVVFKTRNKQPLPLALPPPPPEWASTFHALASEAGVAPTDLVAAFERLAAFWGDLGAADAG